MARSSWAIWSSKVQRTKTCFPPVRGHRSGAHPARRGADERVVSGLGRVRAEVDPRLAGIEAVVANVDLAGAPDLEEHAAARSDVAGDVADEAPHLLQPVRAAVDGAWRILGVERNLVRRDVRRVGDDHGEQLVRGKDVGGRAAPLLHPVATTGGGGVEARPSIALPRMGTEVWRWLKPWK